jgi:hypothetical protein
MIAANRPVPRLPPILPDKIATVLLGDAENADEQGAHDADQR